MPRHHPRRPRVAAGPRRRRRGRRDVPARARDRVRARPPLLLGRGAADPAPPAAARRAVRGLGGPQRRPRARAQPARRDLRRHPRRHRASAAPTTTPASTSGAPAPRRRPPRPRSSSSRTCAPAASSARGEQGSAAKWAHAAMAIASRVLGGGDAAGAPPDPARRAADGRARGRATATRARGALGADLGPDDARGAAARVARRDRARPARPRAARATCRPTASPTRTCTGAPGAATSASCGAVGRGDAAAGGRRGGDWARRRRRLFEACVPAIPYAPATAFPGREKHKLAARDERAAARRARRRRRRRDHGVTRTLEEIRERGVPGFEVEVDRHRRARRPAAARGRRGEVPTTPGLRSACRACRRSSRRSRTAATTSLHLCTPGPGRDRRGADGPAARAAGRRLLPHRAGRLRGPALGRRGAEAAHRRSRWPPSTASATSCSRPRPPRTTALGALGSRPSGSRAGTAASTSPASRPSGACRGCSTPRASTSCTPAG